MNATFSSFEDLIAPVDPEEFLERYWEKDFLHLSRNRPGHFDGLFSLEDVDRWLASVRGGAANTVALTDPAGSTEGRRDCRPEDIPIEQIYEAFAGGHSVILNHVADWPPLAGLVEALARRFCAEIGVNLYLTPKGSRTFPVHTDDHDVFVLQVYGEKAWRLYEQRLVPVNRSHLRFRQELAFTPEWGKARLEGELLAEPTLKPGDVLYIPRGMPHCAVAKETTSLHITVGVTPMFWLDFLQAAVEQAHVYAPELRRTLPPGMIDDLDAVETMRRDFEAALKAFNEHCSFDEALRVVRWNRVRAQGFPADGHILQIDKLRDLDVESEVERRSGVLLTLDFWEDKFTNIRFGRKHIRAPFKLRRAAEFIRDHRRFRVAQIPGLDDKSRLVLVRRLIREGLLRFADGRPQIAEVPAAQRRSA